MKRNFKQKKAGEEKKLEKLKIRATMMWTEEKNKGDHKQRNRGDVGEYSTKRNRGGRSAPIQNRSRKFEFCLRVVSKRKKGLKGGILPGRGFTREKE